RDAHTARHGRSPFLGVANPCRWRRAIHSLVVSLLGVGGWLGADVAEVANLPGAQHELPGRPPGGGHPRAPRPINTDAVVEAGNHPLGAESPLLVGLTTGLHGRIGAVGREDE